ELPYGDESGSSRRLRYQLPHQLHAARGNRLHRGAVVRGWADSARQPRDLRPGQWRLPARCFRNRADSSNAQRRPLGPEQAVLHLVCRLLLEKKKTTRAASPSSSPITTLVAMMADTFALELRTLVLWSACWNFTHMWTNMRM